MQSSISSARRWPCWEMSSKVWSVLAEDMSQEMRYFFWGRGGLGCLFIL